MADVVHRTTRQYLRSVNTVDYPAVDWIINPDLSAVDGWPPKYWAIAGDVVSLMSVAERDAVDAAELAATRDATSAALADLEGIDRAFALVVLDEINLHAARITAMLNAVDNAGSFGAMKTAIAAIANAPTRTIDDLRTALRSKLGT